MDTGLSQSIPCARRVCQDPCVLFPHLLLVLAVVANCGPVRRKVVMQPYAKIIVHGDVALLHADSFGSSVPQEDMRRTRVHAQLYPVLEILQQLQDQIYQ